MMFLFSFFPVCICQLRGTLPFCWHFASWANSTSVFLQHCFLMTNSSWKPIWYSFHPFSPPQLDWLLCSSSSITFSAKHSPRRKSFSRAILSLLQSTLAPVKRWSPSFGLSIFSTLLSTFNRLVLVFRYFNHTTQHWTFPYFRYAMPASGKHSCLVRRILLHSPTTIPSTKITSKLPFTWTGFTFATLLFNFFLLLRLILMSSCTPNMALHQLITANKRYAWTSQMF